MLPPSWKLLGKCIPCKRKNFSVSSVFHDEIGANVLREFRDCMLAATKSNNVSCNVEIEVS